MKTIKVAKPINMFNATASLAEKTFNATYLRMPVCGVPDILVEDDAGNQEYVSREHNALAGAISLTFANRGTSAGSLAVGLTKVMGSVIDIEVASDINKFLIAEGIIEKFATMRTTIDRITKKQRTDKVWPLTPEYNELVQKALDNPQRVFTTELAPLRLKNDQLIKGKSKISKKSKVALTKLNAVALCLHADTVSMLRQAKRDLSTKCKSAKERETKIAEIDALFKEFQRTGTDQFFLTHTQDLIGRMYSRGGFISTQGSKIFKACIRFGNPEQVSDEDEITIYLGRMAGCKGTDDEAWMAGMDQRDFPSSLEAKAVLSDPACAVVRKDGCANGIGWMSAFFADDNGMVLCNLIGEVPSDLYTYVAQLIERRLELRLTRAEVKSFIMPYSYGATLSSVINKLNESRTMEFFDGLQVWKMIDAVNKVLPISRFLNHVQDQVSMSTASVYRWTMPDGFVCHQENMTSEIVQAGSLSEMKIYATVALDRDKMNRALAPNIIHSIDAYHARLIVTACPFDVIAIHDSFGCHSSNVAEMKAIIQATYQQVIKEDVLNSIFKQLKLSDDENAEHFDLIGQPVNPELIVNPYMFM